MLASEASSRELSDEDFDNRCRYKISLLEFGKAAFPLVQHGVEYIHGRHIDVLCRHLEAVAKKESDNHISRLLINLPPSTSKSTWINVIFIAWVWTWFPEAKFQCFGYTDALIKRDSQLCRDLIKSEWYQRHFPEVMIQRGEDRSDYFANTKGGERLASVPGAGMSTGGHPDYIIFEDPQSREQARRYAARESLSKFYFETIPSRGIARKAAHVVSQQRFHVDDLSGRIVKKHGDLISQDGWSPWHLLKLPMEFDTNNVMEDRGHGGDWRTEAGQLLFPELLDEQAVAVLKRDLGSLQAEAQLQQNPRVEDGALFKVSMLATNTITRASLPKAFDSVVRYWDLAGTAGDGCHTVGWLMGHLRMASDKYYKDRFYILDIERGQWSGDEVIERMIKCAVMDDMMFPNVYKVGFELQPAAAGKWHGEQLKKRLRDWRVFALPPVANKRVRAEPFSNAVAFGEVYLLDGPHVPPLFNEFQLFTGNDPKEDSDQVDAGSGAYAALIDPTLWMGKQFAVAAPTKEVTVFQKYGSVGKCKNDWCRRPAASQDGYCCGDCGKSEDAGEHGRGCHDPTCNQKYTEWFAKQRSGQFDGASTEW